MLPEFPNPKHRALFKNIVYLGALSALLNIDFDIIKGMVSAQFKGKDELIAPNIHAMELGRSYAREYLQCPLPIQVRHSEAVGDRIMIDGNAAAAIGAIYGGATVCAWYPITPSTSLAEGLRAALRPAAGGRGDGRAPLRHHSGGRRTRGHGHRHRGWLEWREVVHGNERPGRFAHDRVPGACLFCRDSRPCFGTSSAPGLPPACRRARSRAISFRPHMPPTATPAIPLMFPSTPRECFDFGADALDLADRLQTPIIVMSDLELGMNDNLSEPFTWDDSRRYDRGKVLSEKDLDDIERFSRYLDVDGDGVGYRTLPGTHAEKGAFFPPAARPATSTPPTPSSPSTTSRTWIGCS